MFDVIVISISLLALVTSFLTAWLTFFRKGELKMTQPAVIFFGPDGSPRADTNNGCSNKIFIRTLLYSTSRRGQMIESMHINVQRAETKQNFSIWVYGNHKLERGSGLFIGPDGVAFNHHFLLPPDGVHFDFLAGDYELRVYANLVGSSQRYELDRLSVNISETHADQLKQENTGIYFDWGPDQQKYHSHIDMRPKTKPYDELLELASLKALQTSDLPLPHAKSKKPQ